MNFVLFQSYGDSGAGLNAAIIGWINAVTIPTIPNAAW